jgi:hypothetical protein
VLFDELSPRAAIGLKKVLQASNEICTMGVSPTMMNAYSVYLHRTQIVVCTNVWRSGLKKLKKEDREWLCANSTYVRVSEPMWIEED